LDSRPLAISRDITGITIAPTPNGAPNRIAIGFNILEKGDGAAIQIIYAGPPNAPVDFEGIIVGAPKPSIEVLKANADDPETAKRLRKAMNLLFLAMGLLFIMLSITITLYTRREQASPQGYTSIRRRRAMAMALLIPGLLYVGTSAFFLIHRGSPLGDVPRAIVGGR
jgi:hypothetical protein